MHPKLPTQHYDWSELARTREFIRALFAGETPDAVCIGIYDEDNPDMLREDVRLFEHSLEQTSS